MSWYRTRSARALLLLCCAIGASATAAAASARVAAACPPLPREWLVARAPALDEGIDDVRAKAGLVQKQLEESIVEGATDPASRLRRESLSLRLDHLERLLRDLEEERGSIDKWLYYYVASDVRREAQAFDSYFEPEPPPWLVHPSLPAAAACFGGGLLGLLLAGLRLRRRSRSASSR